MSTCSQRSLNPHARQSFIQIKTSSFTMCANSQNEAAVFQYIGKTALSVIGPTTGKVYRFPSPGSMEKVDLRDRPGLSQIPVLRELL